MLAFSDRIMPWLWDRDTNFFRGWPAIHPTQRDFLERSEVIVLAMDNDNEHVVGFATAITAGEHISWIPAVVVHPEFKGSGVEDSLLEELANRLDTQAARSLTEATPPLEVWMAGDPRPMTHV